MARLEGLNFRPGKVERTGIKECEEYNAFIFHADEPDEVLTAKAEVDSEPVVNGKNPNNQRFVFRATRLLGRRRLTRLPERHAKNYQAVTGQTGRWGRPIETLRPIIPTYILKAPVVSDTDFTEQEPQYEEQPEGKFSLAELGLEELPKNVSLGINGQSDA